MMSVGGTFKFFLSARILGEDGHAPDELFKIYRSALIHIHHF